ncbi:MAG: PrsW family intramembrane metalloprotease [Patescibacteria group bacterium]
MTHIDVLTLAALGGVIPALVWLWFWLREDRHPEPWQYITLVFIMGIVAVPVVIPFQKSINSCVYLAPLLTYFSWAALEELFKYAAAYFAALRNKVNDEPIDPVIYMIVAALGFAAIENTLFLTEPISKELIVDSVVIANLRFVGATLLHVVCSATVGLFLAFSFYKSRKKKILYLIIGLLTATVIHALFNLIVTSDSQLGGPITALLYTWTGAMFLIFAFEKVKKIR